MDKRFSLSDGESFLEIAVHFECGGARLQGVVAVPARSRETGVVVVVGGPQYRAGSHRQFVLLARRLADAGWPVLRFDTRGMGDSSGDLVDFESSGPDIAAAIAALRKAQPNLERVVLWGLCDAASAALMEAAALPSVAGLVLLNPWSRHAGTLERAQLKTYYARRVFEPEFWRKLWSGGVHWQSAVGEFAGKAFRAVKARVSASFGAGPTAPLGFRQRMAGALTEFDGPMLFILSGRDLVSAEFLEFSASHAALSGLWSRERVKRLDMPAADHTFSSRELRAAVEEATLGWLNAEFSGGRL